MMNDEVKTECGMQTDHGTWPTGHGLRTSARGRRSHSSFIIHHSSFPGFTLIELIIVVAIMAVLASLTFPIMGAVKRNMIRTRARGGLTALETSIEAYKDKFGHYPPDNGGFYSTNQLFYELIGTTNTLVPAPFGTYQTLDGSAKIGGDPASMNAVFANVSGFVNCSRAGNGDEAPVGTTFLRELKANQFLAASIISKPCTVLGLALDGPPGFMLPDAIGQKQINPWRYNSSNPRYNTKSFDLWIDVLVGGKTNRICNWSDQPLIVSTPY